MEILKAQVLSHEGRLCKCGQPDRAESVLSYADEPDRGASEALPPSSPSTDQSFQSSIEDSSILVRVPEESMGEVVDVGLPSPSSSDPMPVPPPRASTPGRIVSGQRCKTRRRTNQNRFFPLKGAGASGRLFRNSSGIQCQKREGPRTPLDVELGVRPGGSRRTPSKRPVFPELVGSRSWSPPPQRRRLITGDGVYGWKSVPANV